MTNIASPSQRDAWPGKRGTFRNGEFLRDCMRRLLQGRASDRSAPQPRPIFDHPDSGRRGFSSQLSADRGFGCARPRAGGLAAYDGLRLQLLGVAFPTFGAAIAGIRYFGDFERFAAISEVTAAKLEGFPSRIVLLLEAADDRIDYSRVSELAHATDDVVVSEIENWQAVFGGKHISVPV